MATEILLGFALAGFLTGYFKTSFGGGVGVILTPILLLFLPARLVLGMLSPLLILGDFAAVYFLWGKWDRKFLFIMLPPMALGVLAGAAFVGQLSDVGVKLVIGAMVVIFGTYQLLVLLRRRALIYVPPRRGIGQAMGFLAGFSSSAAHQGGIVTSPYFVASGLSKEALVATNFGLFAVTNWVKLGSYYAAGLLTWEIIRWDLYVIPLVALGAALGYATVRRVPQFHFNVIVLLIAIASAIKLLFF